MFIWGGTSSHEMPPRGTGPALALSLVSSTPPLVSTSNLTISIIKGNQGKLSASFLDLIFNAFGFKV